RKARLRFVRLNLAHPAIPRERDLFPFPAEQGFAVRAAASAEQAGSVGVEARELAVTRDSVLEAVWSAFLVRTYAEFTGVAHGDQAVRSSISVSNGLSRNPSFDR